MATRISTGISVQATSISVLWVVLEGTGLALALNFTTTMTKSASTNRVISVMITSSRLWKLMMFSITGVAASCSVISHGLGCAPKAAPPAASVMPATVNPSNRRPIWPLDIFMPLALP